MREMDKASNFIGGFSNIISKEIECIDVVDKLLTLKGLKYLYDLNTQEN